MSIEQNKAIARRFAQSSVSSDQGPLKELLAPDFVAHQPSGKQDREEFLQHLNAFLVAFSDSQFTVEEQIAEGDTVVNRTTWQGIHSGNFQGLPATGKEVAIRAILIERIRDGQIVEHRGLFDQLSLMQQLGLIPAGEQAG